MKSLTVYRSPKGWVPDLEKLKNNLSNPEKMGYQWKVLRNDDPFITVGDNTLIVCEKQEKLLPASVINRELKIRAEKQMQLQGYKVGKKQMRDLKEQITAELYAKAFTTIKPVAVWIDQKADLLCIETTSDSMADDVYMRLARDMDYRGYRLQPDQSVDAFMKNLILSDDSSIGNFSLGRSCVLQDAESGSKRITYKNEALDTGVVSNYVLQGKKPVKLEIALGLGDCFFMIDTRFVVSKITLPDLVENRSEFDTDDDYFDSEFTIRAGQCRGIIFSLLEELGEQESEEKDAA